MLIGIDLDHTIIDYSEAFNSLAKEWELVPLDFYGTKTQLREYLKNKNAHEGWMRLQGYVYGKGIHHAKLMPGFKEFIQLCRAQKIETLIVSHKTLYGHYDEDKINLREAALNWMTEQEFFTENLAFSKEQIFFAATKEEKIDKIKLLKCTHFIDDLIDIFTHSSYSPTIKSYLLNLEKPPVAVDYIQLCQSWSEVSDKILR